MLQMLMLRLLLPFLEMLLRCQRLRPIWVSELSDPNNVNRIIHDAFDQHLLEATNRFVVTSGSKVAENVVKLDKESVYFSQVDLLAGLLKGPIVQDKSSLDSGVKQVQGVCSIAGSPTLKFGSLEPDVVLNVSNVSLPSIVHKVQQKVVNGPDHGPDNVDGRCPEGIRSVGEPGYNPVDESVSFETGGSVLGGSRVVLGPSSVPVRPGTCSIFVPEIVEVDDDNITFAGRLARLKKEKKKRKEDLKASREDVTKVDRPSPILVGRSGRFYCDCEDLSCEGFCKSWYVLNRKVPRDLFEGVNLRSRKNVASTSGSFKLVDHGDDLEYGDVMLCEVYTK
ncbi:uncharacterized protein [Rutidosis leptorrhynchoides]|uniref:uncharacterized protein n=1 Tax=Rutidosis leptorrhynchoides TaxID=125765 RepID=UPI003A991027